MFSTPSCNSVQHDYEKGEASNKKNKIKKIKIKKLKFFTSSVCGGPIQNLIKFLSWNLWTLNPHGIIRSTCITVSMVQLLSKLASFTSFKFDGAFCFVLLTASHSKWRSPLFLLGWSSLGFFPVANQCGPLMFKRLDIKGDMSSISSAVTPTSLPPTEDSYNLSTLLVFYSIQASRLQFHHGENHFELLTNYSALQLMSRGYCALCRVDSCSFSFFSPYYRVGTAFWLILWPWKTGFFLLMPNASQCPKDP